MPGFGRSSTERRQHVRAALELAEKLVMEVVAVGQHHQRRVLHRRMPHHAGGEEEHGETLAAALRVPDHTRAAVARIVPPNLRYFSPFFAVLDLCFGRFFLRLSF